LQIKSNLLQVYSKKMIIFATDIEGKSLLSVLNDSSQLWGGARKLSGLSQKVIEKKD